MRSGLILSVVALGLVAGSAEAQTRKQSRECSYVNGVQSCVLTTDYGDYTSKQTCDYPGGSATNSSCTTERNNNAPGREEARYSVSEEARKARVRAESGYRDPPGTRELR